MKQSFDKRASFVIFLYRDTVTLTLVNDLNTSLSSAHNTSESYRSTEGRGQKFGDWRGMRELFSLLSKIP